MHLLYTKQEKYAGKIPKSTDFDASVMLQMYLTAWMHEDFHVNRCMSNIQVKFAIYMMLQQ